MAVNSVEVRNTLADADFPAPRRALVAWARQKHVAPELVNTIHRVPDRQYQSPDDVGEAVDEVARKEQRLWQTLDAATPPTAPLGNTTDYEQVVLAWGKRQRVTIDELIHRLDETGASMARQLADDLRSDAFKRRIFEQALHGPLSGASAESPHA